MKVLQEHTVKFLENVAGAFYFTFYMNFSLNDDVTAMLSGNKC